MLLLSSATFSCTDMRLAPNSVAETLLVALGIASWQLGILGSPIIIDKQFLVRFMFSFTMQLFIQ